MTRSPAVIARRCQPTRQSSYNIKLPFNNANQINNRKIPACAEKTD
jgi:hypothetical protein